MEDSVAQSAKVHVSRGMIDLLGQVLSVAGFIFSDRFISDNPLMTIELSVAISRTAISINAPSVVYIQKLLNRIMIYMDYNDSLIEGSVLK